MVDKAWQNDWLQLKSVIHKIKTVADARVNRCYHSAGPAQEVGRQAKRALFKSVLNCCCTAPVTLSVASVPCQRSGRTFASIGITDTESNCDLQQSYGAYNFFTKLEIRTVRVWSTKDFIFSVKCCKSFSRCSKVSVNVLKFQ